ncbi:hypothetical protein ACF0H5_001735 [Mactra antiquata]
MTSSVKKIFGCCVPSNVKERQDFDDVIFDKKTEILHFIIPQKHYEEFVKMKPEDDEILNLRQYMYLYKFTRMFEMRKCPGKDYERASYMFADRDISFWLQGWIPTKPLPEPKTDDISVAKYNLHTVLPCKKNAIHPHQNTYIGGNITNWSRQYAEPVNSGNEKMPVQLLPRQRLAIFSDENRSIFHELPKYSSESPTYVAESPEDVREVHTRELETTAVNQFYNSTVHRVGSCVVTTSTFNPRDRRLRPKAAKGQRTRRY